MRLYLRTDPKVTNDLGARLRASGWTEISLHQRELHALAPGTINGKRVTWVLDTGAGITLDRNVAVAAGLKPAGKRIAAHTLCKLGNTGDATEIPRPRCCACLTSPRGQ